MVPSALVVPSFAALLGSVGRHSAPLRMRSISPVTGLKKSWTSPSRGMNWRNRDMASMSDSPGKAWGERGERERERERGGEGGREGERERERGGREWKEGRRLEM